MKLHLLLFTFLSFAPVKMTRAADCPIGYIAIPNQPFCVMKYIASLDQELRAESKKALPKARYNRAMAQKACEANGKNYHLITSNEWMTIARIIESYGPNWSSGIAGKGILSRGMSDSSSMSIPGEDAQDSEVDWTHRRTHLLSNNEVIWDLAGLLWQWVMGDIEIPYESPPREFSDLSLPVFLNGMLKPFGPIGPFNSDQNMGKFTIMALNGQANGIIRGGGYWNKNEAGIYAAFFNYDNTLTSHSVGFRCTYSLNTILSK